MARDAWSDLSVQISRRRWRCVPDPQLCLSHNGAAFIGALMPHAEIWPCAEFLSILDTAMPYDRDIERLAASLGGHHRPHEIRESLRIWARLRDEVGQGGARLYWVRDALRESCLPGGMDEAVVPHWEMLAQALDERVSEAAESSGPTVAAIRDTVALAAVLPGAVVLTHREQADEAAPPLLCRHLEAWRVPCRRLEGDNDLVALERNQLLQLLVETGLAGFVWSGLRLAVAHLVAPAQPPPAYGRALIYARDDGDFLIEEEPRPLRGPWEDARAFWYDLGCGDFS
jgi:hypothetical protein